MLGLFIAVGLTIYTGAPLYLTSQSGSAMIRNSISARIPGRVSFEIKDLSFLPGRLVLSTIRIETQTGGIVVKTDRAVVDFYLPALLRSEIKVDSITVDKPEIHLETESNGRLNIVNAFSMASESTPDKPDEKNTSLPFNLIVDNLKITGGIFQYQDGGDIDLYLEGIGVNASEGNLLNKTATLSFSLDKGRITAKNFKTGIRPSHFKAAMDKDGFHPVTASLDSDMGTFTLSGQTGPFSGNLISPENLPELKADFSVNTDLAPFSGLFFPDRKENSDVSPFVSGMAELYVKASGKLNNPDVSMNMTLRNGRVGDIAPIDFHLETELKNGMIKIKNTYAGIFNGEVSLSGSADVTQAFPKGFFISPVSLDQVEYNATADFKNLRPGIPFWDETRLSSHISISGKGISLNAIKSEADITSVIMDGRKPGANSISTAAALALNNGILSLKHCDVSGFAADVNAAGAYDIKTKKIDANLNASVPRIETTAALPGASIMKRISGGFNLRADVNGAITNPSVNAVMTAHDLGFDDVVLGNLNVHAGKDAPGTKIMLHELSLSNRSSGITLSGGIDLFEYDNNKGFVIRENPEIDMKAIITNADPYHFMPEMKTSASVNADITVKGPIKMPEARLALSAKNIVHDRLHAGNIDTELTFSKGSVSISHLKLTNRNSTLEASGAVAILTPDGSPVMDPEPVLNIHDGSIIMTDFLDNAKGRLSLSGNIGGSMKSPQAALSVKGNGLGVKDVTLGDLTVEASLAAGKIVISDLEIANNRSHLRFQGEMDLFESSGAEEQAFKPADDPAIRMDTLQGSFFLEDFYEGIKGSVIAKPQISGTLKKPTAELSVSGEGLSLFGLSLDSFRLASGLENGMFHLKSLDIRKVDSILTASGSAVLLSSDTGAILSDPGIDLKLKGKDISISDIAAKALPGLSGLISIEADIKGSLKQPNGNFGIQGKSIKMEEKSIPSISNLLVKGALNGGRIFIQPFSIALAKEGRIEGDGEYAPETGTFLFSFYTKGIELASLLQNDSGNDLKGSVHLTIEGEGDINKPKVTGRLSISNPSLNGEPLQNVDLNMSLSERTIIIKGDAIGEVDMRHDLESKDFSIIVSLDGADLSPLLTFMKNKDMLCSASGSITATGNMDAPVRTLKGKAVLSQFSLKKTFRDENENIMKTAELIHSNAVDTSFESGIVAIKALDLTLLNKGRITASGSTGMENGTNLGIHAVIPMETAAVFLPEMGGLKGMINLSAQINGCIHKPDVEADLILSDVGMTIPLLVQNLNKVNAQITISDNNLFVRHFSGYLDEGRFDISGAADLDGLFPRTAAFHLKTSQLPVRIPETGELVAAADLNFSNRSQAATENNTNPPFRLSGEIILTSGFYTKDMKIGLVDQIRNEAESLIDRSPGQIKDVTGQSITRDGFPGSTVLDVSVISRGSLMLDNNVAAMNLYSDLQIGGTVNKPAVTGKLGIDPGGTVSYQGKQFEITKGAVEFTDPYGIDPVIDLESNSEIRKWNVTLNVQGRPDNLAFSLTSDPYEDHESILSLILTGKTREELISGDVGDKGLIKSLAPELVSDLLKETIKEKTGLDYVDVKIGGDENSDYPDTSTTSPTGRSDNEQPGENDVSLTLGKSLSRRMSIKYGVETRDGEVVQKITSEYKLLENLMFNSFRDTKNNFGGELVYRLEFR